MSLPRHSAPRAPRRGRVLAAAAVLAGIVSAANAVGQPLPDPSEAQPPAPSMTAGPSFAPTPPTPLRDDQVALLVQALQAAELEGFGAHEFFPAELGPLLSASGVEREQGLSLLRREVAAYAAAEHGLRLPSASFDKNWGLQPDPYDAPADFAAAAAGDRLKEWLQSLPPPSDRYRALRSALAQYRAVAAAGGWTSLGEGPTLRLGARSAAVLALRRRLQSEDPAQGLDVTDPLFDQAVATALSGFQHNVGLSQTGVLDAATRRDLNVPVATRLAQIKANMERWRWMPRDLSATRIEVNIAAEEMDAFVDGDISLEMRAAPGRPDDQTPILTSRVTSIVFDPPWNVPSSIAKKELWPKEAAHPGYLAAHGYRVITSPDGASTRIQQRFGPKSALGRIKFDFPNTYSVYLHDTPSRAAFSRTSRAVSHGCVRLQRPKELAELLLQGSSEWTPEHISDVIGAGDTVRASLAAPMPIYLAYWTAFLDVKGRVNFRDDVYGWDAELMGLIAAAER